MQFHNFAENLLGSRVKIKLVRQLLLEEAITSERDLAKLLGISHTAVSKTLKELHEFNLVSPMREIKIATLINSYLDHLKKA
ncbi:helix-turn-helix transcriptional regulator [Candidatus Pacearchaeota archaeon]|nr:helix-turn-helix transcriptional regulator [Candidatus Pacearchaeota archaeon]